MKKFPAESTCHSERRPAAQAWRVSSGGHTTYARSQSEAIHRHSMTLETYRLISDTVKACADLRLSDGAKKEKAAPT